MRPTLANLGNDHVFIGNEYYLHCYEKWYSVEAQSKATSTYAQSGQISYHCGGS